MIPFDALSDRVQAAAGLIGAFGYLNSGGGPTLEVRFQMRPPSALWDHRPMGFSERFADGAALAAYLDALEEAAAHHRGSLERGEPGALDRVLELALASMRG